MPDANGLAQITYKITLFNIFVPDLRPPSAHEPDPAANPGTVAVHAAHPRHCDGRRVALRMHLHPTLLHT